jgi:hypothetical protein
MGAIAVEFVEPDSGVQVRMEQQAEEWAARDRGEGSPAHVEARAEVERLTALLKVLVFRTAGTSVLPQEVRQVELWGVELQPAADGGVDLVMVHPDDMACRKPF